MPSERRTRRDFVVAGVITAVMAATAGGVLLTGSAANSEFIPAGAEQPVYGPATEAPTSLDPLWSHGSQGTGAPLTTKGNLVTVDADGTLVGRDAGSGEQRWSYDHTGRLCAATYYAEALVAAFDGADGCSDVTAINPTTQEYTSTRQSAFADAMVLSSTWQHALALSPERLEIWRDDLVRTIEYGTVEAPQEAGQQPRSGCMLGSAALTDARFAVAESCPEDDSMRLTLSKTVPEDNRKPEDIESGVTGADSLWVLGMTDEGTLALTQRGAEWAVEWFTAPDRYSPVLPLPGEPAHLPTQDAVSGDLSQLRWFDGASTHAFDIEQGTFAWSAPGATGPGLTGGWSPDPDDRTVRDWVLVPREGGFVAVDHATGAERGWLAAGPDDDDDDGTVDSVNFVTGLAQIGDILYERRGHEIHAFKMVR